MRPIAFSLPLAALLGCALSPEPPAVGSAELAIEAGWTAAAPMPEARAYHRATLLASGDVLLIGNYDPSQNPGAPPDSAVVYLAREDAWLPVASTHYARGQHAVARLQDGRVLVSGGVTNDKNEPLLGEAELFDPDDGSWTLVASMIDPRGLHSATLLDDGRVLVAGGHPMDPQVAMRSAELFDPATESFVAAPSMYARRQFHTATPLADGRVLLAGGTLDSQTAEIFDPSTNGWTPTAPMIHNRVGHVAVRLPNGDVLVSGGVDNYAKAVLEAERYDPVLDTWTPAGLLSMGRSHTAVALLPDGRVLVAGGFTLHGEAVEVHAESDVYNPETNAWSAAGSMHEARCAHTGTLLADGRLLVTGGVSSSDEMKTSAEWFMPATGAPCAGPDACPSGNGTCTSLPEAPSGECRRPCVSIADCPAPLACGPEGFCVPAPDAESDHSGCHAARATGGDAAGVALAAIAIAISRVRRKRRAISGSAG
jgi:hypothetical protein